MHWNHWFYQKNINYTFLSQVLKRYSDFPWFSGKKSKPRLTAWNQPIWGYGKKSFKLRHFFSCKTLLSSVFQLMIAQLSDPKKLYIIVRWIMYHLVTTIMIKLILPPKILQIKGQCFCRSTMHFYHRVINYYTFLWHVLRRYNGSPASSEQKSTSLLTTSKSSF